MGRRYEKGNIFNNSVAARLALNFSEIRKMERFYSIPDGWLRGIRRIRRMRVKTVAEKMGVHPSQVIHFENNEIEKTISLKSFEKYANAINCELVVFVLPREYFINTNYSPFLIFRKESEEEKKPHRASRNRFFATSKIKTEQSSDGMGGSSSSEPSTD